MKGNEFVILHNIKRSLRLKTKAQLEDLQSFTSAINHILLEGKYIAASCDNNYQQNPNN